MCRAKLHEALGEHIRAMCFASHHAGPFNVKVFVCGDDTVSSIHSIGWEVLDWDITEDWDQGIKSVIFQRCAAPNLSPPGFLSLRKPSPKKIVRLILVVAARPNSDSDISYT